MANHSNPAPHNLRRFLIGLTASLGHGVARAQSAATAGVPPENPIQDDVQLEYGNEAPDGRVSDPAAACYPGFTRRARLEAENLILRQQLVVLRRKSPKRVRR
jgi:hypothetical protein